jgi:hypothetical protein
VGVSVDAFESTVLPSSRHRFSQYLLPISDTSETVTPMETAPPNMALFCVPSSSVTNSQTVLIISAETSFSTLSTTLCIDAFPEEITSSTPSKYSIKKQQFSFFIAE